MGGGRQFVALHFCFFAPCVVLVFKSVPYLYIVFDVPDFFAEDNNLSSQNKCAKYWPDEEYTYGNLRVSLLTDTLYPNFIERTFELLPTGSSTAVTVKQYHLTNWRGPVPDQAAFIDFMYYTRFLTKDRREPVLIHSP